MKITISGLKKIPKKQQRKIIGGDWTYIPGITSYSECQAHCSPFKFLHDNNSCYCSF